MIELSGAPSGYFKPRLEPFHFRNRHTAVPELKWLLQKRFGSETVMIQIYNGRIMYDIIAAIPQRAQSFVRV